MKFGDIGHGFGNVAFQATLNIGCRSVGIEINEQRYQMSERLFGRSQKIDVSDIIGKEVSFFVFKSILSFNVYCFLHKILSLC